MIFGYASKISQKTGRLFPSWHSRPARGVEVRVFSSDSSISGIPPSLDSSGSRLYGSRLTVPGLRLPAYGSRLCGSRLTAPDYAAPGLRLPTMRLPAYGSRLTASGWRLPAWLPPDSSFRESSLRSATILQKLIEEATDQQKEKFIEWTRVGVFHPQIPEKSAEVWLPRHRPSVGQFWSYSSVLRVN